LPYSAPALTELELRYPFVAQSRKFFESMPMEEGLESKEVIQQAQSRLLNALGRARYEPHLSEFIEFSSFFAAALVASQDSFLTSKFAKKEGERSKGFFVSETSGSKISVMEECFSVHVGPVEREGKPLAYSMRFEEYLTLVADTELTKAVRWKLVRQPLQDGMVYMSDNLLNDLFGDAAESLIAQRTKNLRKGVFPKHLSELRADVLRFVPTQRAKSGAGYVYVDELLKHPVSDGRHRLVWLVLAPYLVNVKKLENEEAIDRIRAFVAVAGETRDMRRFIEYNVRRARRNGLMPPTFSTLKSEHPDIYSLLPAAALTSDLRRGPQKGQGNV
jgi:hypothetical protein